MAYFDHAAAREKQLCKETYESLKEWVLQNNKKYSRAVDHMISMESLIEKQKKALDKYDEFFKTLKEFLPRY